MYILGENTICIQGKVAINLNPEGNVGVGGGGGGGGGEGRVQHTANHSQSLDFLQTHVLKWCAPISGLPPVFAPLQFPIF